MRLYSLVVGWMLAVLAVSTVAAPRPGGLGTVGGQVLGLDGKPVVGARVTLQAAEGHRVETAETNEQGRFWFASLPEGQYGVRAYSQGRVSEWRQNVWVAPGQQTNVVLHLRAKRSSLSENPRRRTSLAALDSSRLPVFCGSGFPSGSLKSAC
ncbi:MAG TPA: carboxypeptidase-like regulatory domain-containing protein [Candidatus Acidoferrales bacterium]|nr:carboxypeptidase-like regulatory domain-containing protein [Candidatus Acidoferrales bacterium]